MRKHQQEKEDHEREISLNGLFDEIAVSYSSHSTLGDP
jgi:hypothetical protein